MNIRNDMNPYLKLHMIDSEQIFIFKRLHIAEKPDDDGI